jgi:hypothetical protein
MFLRLRRNPRRPPITPRKNSLRRYGMEHRVGILTISTLLCGIFPVPHFTIGWGWAAPGWDGKVFDVLRTIAVWNRNLNFTKEKNRP